jgi:hypothetical protein
VVVSWLVPTDVSPMRIETHMVMVSVGAYLPVRLRVYHLAIYTCIQRQTDRQTHICIYVYIHTGSNPVLSHIHTNKIKKKRQEHTRTHTHLSIYTNHTYPSAASGGLPAVLEDLELQLRLGLVLFMLQVFLVFGGVFYVGVCVF